MFNLNKFFLLVVLLLFFKECFPVSDSVLGNISKEDILGTKYDPLSMNSVSTGELFSGDYELTQYSPVKITNTGKETFVIKTSSETIEIASNSTQEVILEETIVDYFFDGKQRTVTIKENQSPVMIIQSLVNMQGEEVKLSMIQRVTSYRITVKDDFTGQLDVKIHGPVKWKIAKKTGDILVIDITLDLYTTRSVFEAFRDNSNQDEYTTFFNITVKDLYAPHKTSGTGFFRFTDW